MSVTEWLHGDADVWMIQDLLRGVIDPEVGVDIVNLGLIYGLSVSPDGAATIRMTLTTPGCPLSGYMDDAVHDVLWGAPGINSVDLQIVWDPPWDTSMMSVQAKRELGWIR
ncbi:metal-sulfur cluster assembly factor [Spelaeicoccus albus]|uniref:Metal-sulfur cluster biosynthetic enzyme n=1 Tax=Spelaeicoccus albus TaxID=1280376 RepID=A0A7Z0D278_9MICO|nr:metal-sulfur cluster assembly factor [Spelaeicoccus albus]NYI67501.1 metal-sulfur cluster biosynthetic enzyme [Spelaeicoccus albus]